MSYKEYSNSFGKVTARRDLIEYLYVGIIALIIIVLLLFFLMKKGEQFGKPSSLATFGMVFVIFGIIFIGTGRLISYSFFGIAVLLSIIDMIRIQKNKERSI
ncbi:hypothetical protein ACFLVC_00845 [Chloroflexota bacterium]